VPSLSPDDLPQNIDHSRTKTKSPQTNGIVERFHRTLLNECYRIAFRRKIYRLIEQLQVDLDSWIASYNKERPHQGRWCFGKTPMQTFLDALPMDPTALQTRTVRASLGFYTLSARF
jgi:hypothetical protein